MPRLVKSETRGVEADRDRVFHMAVREALMLFLRAYERRFLPGIGKSDRQTTGNRG